MSKTRNPVISPTLLPSTGSFPRKTTHKALIYNRDQIYWKILEIRTFKRPSKKETGEDNVSLCLEKFTTVYIQDVWGLQKS